MKRLMSSTLVLAVLALGFTGCGDETKVVEKKEITTPTGSTTVTTEKKIESKGDNPPATTEGTAKSNDLTAPK